MVPARSACVRLMMVVVLLGVPAGLAGAAQVYRCDFEAAEGYTVGGLNGQNGWVADGASIIQTGQTSSGSRALEMVAMGDYSGQFVNMAERSLADVTEDNPLVTITQDVKITDLDEAEWQFSTMDLTQFALTGTVRFEKDGDILVNGSDTGTNWVENVWRELVMVLDFDADQIDVYYGGTQIANNVALLESGVGFDKYVLATDDRVDLGSSMFYDDLLITALPEPVSAALLAAGLVGMWSRRRRRG